jgi:uncharacterized phage protein (TIGR02218 family)
VSYLAQEQSIEGAKPAELYLFKNATDTFAYTSAPFSIGSGGVTYQPVAIVRTDPNRASLQTDDNLVFTLPATDPFVARYISGVPSSADQLTIYRQHLSDGGTPETITYWVGSVSSVAFEGDVAKIETRPASSILVRTIPNRCYQSLCGHVLYDRGCKISDASFKFPVTVTALDATKTTLTVSGASISGHGAGYFDGGFVRWGGIDYRMVLSSTDLGGNVLSVAIMLPFTSVAVNSALDLFAGCDHTLATCAAKFSNTINFGGFPYVPSVNPFSAGIGS